MQQPTTTSIQSLCVYCASSSTVHPDYFEAARRLGTLMAGQGIGLVYGAGNMGLMGTVADAVLAAGGRVTGVIPRFMVERGWHHTSLSELRVTDDMHQRKRLMAHLGDAAIALPGGCGTLEELLEVITWKQLGLYLKPVVLLNVRGYFDPLLRMLELAVDEHFMAPAHAALWTVARTPDEALRLAAETPLWNPAIRKFDEL